ncbi:hypothetical protein GCM10009119_14100 [Algoriphagus jejuensis]|uniref:Uncharacterized protein n=1 Tax=Algoriphagus jejuensis TaxID=419934 RepID=A0ABP3YC30_9BACT
MQDIKIKTGYREELHPGVIFMISNDLSLWNFGGIGKNTAQVTGHPILLVFSDDLEIGWKKNFRYTY